MKFMEALRFQWLTGIADILGDLDKYVTYILLVNAVGCNNWSEASGLYFIAYAVMAIVAQPLSGYVADNCGEHLHRVLLAFQFAIMLGMVGMIMVSHSFYALGALYVMRWLFGIMAFTCTWKIVKVRVELECGDDFLEQQARMNRIGTIGDLGGQVIEIAVMTTVFCVAFFTNDPSYTVVKTLLYASFLGLQASLLLVTATFSKEYVLGHDLPPSASSLTAADPPLTTAPEVLVGLSISGGEALARSASAPSEVSPSHPTPVNVQSMRSHDKEVAIAISPPHLNNVNDQRPRTASVNSLDPNSPVVTSTEARPSTADSRGSQSPLILPNTPGSPATPLPGLNDGVYLHARGAAAKGHAKSGGAVGTKTYDATKSSPPLGKWQRVSTSDDGEDHLPNGTRLAANRPHIRVKVMSSDEAALATATAEGGHATAAAAAVNNGGTLSQQSHHVVMPSPHSGSGSDASGKSSSSENDELKGLLHENHVKARSPPPTAHWWTVTWYYFTVRMGEIWQNSIAINCLLLSYMISTVMGLFEFPVTLNEAIGEAHRPGTFCQGSLDFMLAQAAVLQVVYLVVGGFYFTVLMKRIPLTYFGLSFPIMVLVVVAFCVPLLFNLPTMPAAVLVSFATVIPYYLNCYVFYCLYSAVKQEHYGFTQGLYGFGTNVVGLIPYITVAVSLSQLITMMMCFVLLAVAVFHSMTFAFRHRAILAHIETPHATEQREKADLERSRNSKASKMPPPQSSSGSTESYRTISPSPASGVLERGVSDESTRALGAVASELAHPDIPDDEDEPAAKLLTSADSSD